MKKFTVAVNYFKSQGRKGIGAHSDRDDGQGNWNATGTAAAKDLIGWPTTVLAALISIF